MWHGLRRGFGGASPLLFSDGFSTSVSVCLALCRPASRTGGAAVIAIWTQRRTRCSAREEETPPLVHKPALRLGADLHTWVTCTPPCPLVRKTNERFAPSASASSSSSSSSSSYASSSSWLNFLAGLLGRFGGASPLHSAPATFRPPVVELFLLRCAQRPW